MTRQIEAIITVAVVVFLSGCFCTSVPSELKPVLSDTNGARLQELAPVEWKMADKAAEVTPFSVEIKLNPSKRFQRFDGVGGSFMRAGATVLNQMPSDVQANILRDLFHPEQGAGFAIAKVPIAAWYVPLNDKLKSFYINFSFLSQCFQ